MDEKNLNNLFGGMDRFLQQQERFQSKIDLITKGLSMSKIFESQDLISKIIQRADPMRRLNESAADLLRMSQLSHNFNSLHDFNASFSRLQSNQAQFEKFISSSSATLAFFHSPLEKIFHQLSHPLFREDHNGVMEYNVGVAVSLDAIESSFEDLTEEDFVQAQSLIENDPDVRNAVSSSITEAEKVNNVEIPAADEALKTFYSDFINLVGAPIMALPVPVKVRAAILATLILIVTAVFAAKLKDVISADDPRIDQLQNALDTQVQKSNDLQKTINDQSEVLKEISSDLKEIKAELDSTPASKENENIDDKQK